MTRKEGVTRREFVASAVGVFPQDGAQTTSRGVGLGVGTYDPLRDWFLQNVRLKDGLAEKGLRLNYQWGITDSGYHSEAALPQLSDAKKLFAIVHNMQKLQQGSLRPLGKPRGSSIGLARRTLRGPWS